MATAATTATTAAVSTQQQNAATATAAATTAAAATSIPPQLAPSGHNVGVKAMVPFVTPTEELVRRLEKVLKASLVGKWQMNCTFYLSKRAGGEQPADTATSSGLSNDLYVFSFETDLPNKHILVLKNVILEADAEMITIIKNSKLYERRQQFQIKGSHYTLGDFSIRTGSLSLNNSSKGWVVEIEYRACAMVGKAEEILKEFINGNIEPTEQEKSANPTPNQIIGLDNAIYAPFNLPDVYSLRHTAYQYTLLFHKVAM